MDIATLIGIVIGFVLIGGSMMMGGSLSAFFNVPGLMIVVGGTFAAALINERMSNVIGAVKVAVQAFVDRKSSPVETIERVVQLAAKARKEGLVSLEGEEIDDVCLARGVRLGVDGLSPEIIEGILRSELQTLKQRHTRGQTVFRFMGSTAPAMGMVGTLIGLVQMLKTLDDPAAIGPAMAIALLTTLYGAILAFLLFNPIASKLESRTAEEVAQKQLAIVGVEAILRGDNSMVIQSKLESFLSPAEKNAGEAKS
ncbi:MAG: MotA/TolQ/ExbB proton channel family protein [Myxococcales bacterium]|nr:MotA/TolQ/ExbB proton channel family protein [Myxococcales bacterium]